MRLSEEKLLEQEDSRFRIRKGRMKKFLVTRMEALREINSYNPTIKTSELWPVIVEAKNHSEAILKAYEIAGWGEPGKTKRSFLVIELDTARKVTFTPTIKYSVLEEPYELSKSATRTN